MVWWFGTPKVSSEDFEADETAPPDSISEDSEGGMFNHSISQSTASHIREFTGFKLAKQALTNGEKRKQGEGSSQSRTIEVKVRSANPAIKNLVETISQLVDPQEATNIHILGLKSETASRVDEMCNVFSYPNERMSLTNIFTPLRFGSCLSAFKIPKEFSMLILAREDERSFITAILSIMARFQNHDPHSLENFNALEEISYNFSGGDEAVLPYGMLMGIYKQQSSRGVDVWLVIGGMDGVATDALSALASSSAESGNSEVSDSLISEVMHCKRAFQNLVERTAFSFLMALAKYMNVEQQVVVQLAPLISAHSLGIYHGFEKMIAQSPPSPLTAGVGLTPEMYSDVDHIDTTKLASRCIHLQTSTKTFLAVCENPLSGLIICEKKPNAQEDFDSIPVCYTSINFPKPVSIQSIQNNEVETWRLSEPPEDFEKETTEVFYQGCLLGKRLVEGSTEYYVNTSSRTPAEFSEVSPLNVTGILHPIVVSLPLNE